MKKRNLNKLAFLGIASGLIALNNPSAHSSQVNTTGNLDLHLLLAEHKCSGKHGCPAEKDSTKTSSTTNTIQSKKTSALVAEKDKEDGNLGYHPYTEDELLLELNDKGTALYNSLDSEGKALARLVASQRCDHTNECKGLNACQTEKNKCAGKGSCKGEGKCALSDKNLAVKLVADKLAKKRVEANKGK